MHSTTTFVPTPQNPLPSENLGWSKGIAILTMVLGLTVLSGWALDIDALKHLLPGLVSMKANTAAAFALSGICLYLHTLRHTPPAILLVRRVAAALILLLGLVTFAEYFFGWNAGIDQLLFSEPAGEIFTSYPGRMSNITATNFALIGSALLLADIRFWLAAQTAAFAVATSTLLPLGGYMFFNLSLIRIGNTTAIAAHTAAGFLMLAVGVLMTTQSHGFMVRLQKKSRTIGLATSLVTLIFIFGAASYNFVQKDKANQWVEHTLEVIINMESFSDDMHDFLYHNRGFLITGDVRQLTESDKSRDAMLAALARVRQLTSGNAAQQERLEALGNLVKQRIEQSDLVVRVRREKGPEAAAAMVLSGAGNTLTNEFESKLNELENTEKNLLKERQKIAEAMSSSSLLTLGFLLSASLVLLLWVFRTSQREISERKQAELKAQALVRRNQLLMQSTHEGIHILDDQGSIIEANEAFCRHLGYTQEEILQFNVFDWDAKLTADGFRTNIEKLQNSHAVFETVHRRKDGTLVDVEVSTSGIDLDGRKCFFSLSRDITERKQAAEEIENLAFYDSLTHLPNRRLLLDRLKQALASSARSGLEGALLFIDLDNFKNLNDTLGHDIGDLLLQQVAQRLESCVREGDTVARLGGDEFVVMLEDLSEHALEAAAQTEAVGNKILDTLNQPYQLGKYEHHSTPSIGATLFNEHEHGMDELLKQADIAMYQAKKAGRNTLRFFDPAMQAAISLRVALESDLRRAVSGQEQFMLYYQPQVDSSGRLIGAEALARWRHPERGMVSPAEFIPLAEETGLILPLGHWVLTIACRQLEAWAAQPEMAHLTVAVNISAKQFHLPTFVEEVLSLVDYFGVDPAKLKLEITESLLLDNVDDIIAKMTALKARGISFSMDDFGTGYSSLQYLKRLPLDQLKIDQSFVHNISADESDKAIVRTIIAMAQSLNLSVIAEGVETEVQRQLLLNKGCTTYQGYLFGRPVPIEQFEALLKQG